MALKNIIAGVATGAGRISERFDDIMFAAVKALVIAVAIAAVHKYAGLRALGDGQAWFIYFGVGVAAVMTEYFCTQVLVDSWFSRKIGGVLIGGAMTAIAVLFSYSSAISSAAVQQSEAAGVQKANFRKTENTEAAVKESEFALKAAMDARSKLQPTRSAAEARAAIDSAQAHKWWAYTESCAKPRGRDSRAWCDAYRSAVADLALWDDISREDARIGALKAKVDEARAQEAEAPATVSAVRADVLEYAAWFGTDADGGQVIQARHIALTITAFVTLMGFLTAWKRNQGRELPPWGIVDWLRRQWDPEAAPVVRAAVPLVPHNISISDDRAMAALKSVLAEMKSAVQPALKGAA